MELGRRGAKVIVNYANSSESAEEVVAGIKEAGSDAVAIKANVSDVDQIVSLFAQAKQTWGKLDVVCSNSGVVSFGHVKDVTPEEFDRVFNINTRGQFFVAREAYKNLEVGGRLIMMGSITGQAKGVPKHAVYSGSKGTIETFVRCMAIDFGDKKITVNAIAPGGIKTDMYHAVCREYIPGGVELDDDSVDEVCPVPHSLTPMRKNSKLMFVSVKIVRCWLVTSAPCWSPHRHCSRRLLPRIPGRRVDQRQGPRYRRCCLHVRVSTDGRCDAFGVPMSRGPDTHEWSRRLRKGYDPLVPRLSIILSHPIEI